MFPIDVGPVGGGLDDVATTGGALRLLSLEAFG